MERMTDKRMAEIDSTRLDFGKRNPLPADSELSEELLQALKADRAQLKAVRELCTLYFEGCDSITFDDAMLKIRAAIGESGE
jgi:ferritin-like protein